MTITTFREHCVKGAKTFVQTAIIIDNQAVYGDSTSPQEPEPKTAVMRPVRLLKERATDAETDQTVRAEVHQPRPVEPETIIPTREEEPKPAANDSPESEIRGNESGDTVRQPHDLRAKDLTDAFNKFAVICGVYRPGAGENLADVFTAAAQHADIVIIDWYLEPHTSQQAKEIIRRILKNDFEEHGRLRLIAVFTSQPGVSSLAGELLKAVEQEDSLKGKFHVDEATHTINSTDTRICFLNKADVTEAADADIVQERDLPERLLQEFASLTEGVLSTYAVNSIAAVRRATHNILSVFSRSLDGAYVSHRCGLLHPDDAKEFARELIASEIATVVGMAEQADQCVSSDVIELWVDHIAAGGRRFSNGQAQLAADSVKAVVRSGVGEINQVSINPKKLTQLFYDSPEEAWRRNSDFSRLSTFKTEAKGRSRFPKAWVPVLSLGSVLKIPRVRPVTREIHDAYGLIEADYLVCVQPRCDSVRLIPPTAFPFQLAKFSGKPFNLVVLEQEGCSHELLVSYKPRDAVMVTFIPDADRGTVVARRDEHNNFIFSDQDGRQFIWVGDIKDLKAQRDASEVAYSVHRVGVDDFEWLRLMGKT
jgi:hypothetical protein